MCLNGKPIPNNIDKDKFFSKIRVDENKCWNWIGTINKYGYGLYYHDKSYFRAHRVSLFLNGKLFNDAMVVDHICRNRKCVNPEHLRNVPQKKNTEILITSHCPNGHEYGLNNFYKEGTGKTCKICRIEQSKIKMKKQREKRMNHVFSDGDMVFCTKCTSYKTFEQFPKCTIALTTMRSVCYECVYKRKKRSK